MSIITKNVDSRRIINLLYKDTLQVGKLFKTKPKRVILTPIYDDVVDFGPLPDDEVTEEMKKEREETKKMNKADLFCV